MVFAFPAARSLRAAALLLLTLVLGGCAGASMWYFPPQNLGELKRGAGDLRGATVLVSMNPQLQLDAEAMDRPRRPESPSVTPYYGRLLQMLKERLESQGAKVTTELHDRNNLSAPKLAQVLAREKAGYLLHLRQERMSTMNGQQAGVVWLAELVKLPAPGSTPGELVFQTQYSVAGLYCIGTPVINSMEPTAMDCLGQQAAHLVGRLAANGFFTGDPAPAPGAKPGLGANWSEPPSKEDRSSTKSLACINQAPGVRCP